MQTRPGPTGYQKLPGPNGCESERERVRTREADKGSWSGKSSTAPPFSGRRTRGNRASWGRPSARLRVPKSDASSHRRATRPGLLRADADLDWRRRTGIGGRRRGATSTTTAIATKTKERVLLQEHDPPNDEPIALAQPSEFVARALVQHRGATERAPVAAKAARAGDRARSPSRARMKGRGGARESRAGLEHAHPDTAVAPVLRRGAQRRERGAAGGALGPPWDRVVPEHVDRETAILGESRPGRPLQRRPPCLGRCGREVGEWLSRNLVVAPIAADRDRHQKTIRTVRVASSSDMEACLFELVHVCGSASEPAQLRPDPRRAGSA